jgi:hypothetical protein
MMITTYEPGLPLQRLTGYLPAQYRREGHFPQKGPHIRNQHAVSE